MNTKFKIDGEGVSSTWSVDILARAFEKPEMKRIWEAYKAARIRCSSQGQPPTKAQIEIVDLYKSGLRPKEIATRKKTTVGVVATAVRRVAIYRLLTE